MTCALVHEAQETRSETADVTAAILIVACDSLISTWSVARCCVPPKLSRGKAWMWKRQHAPDESRQTQHGSVGCHSQQQEVAQAMTERHTRASKRVWCGSFIGRVCRAASIEDVVKFERQRQSHECTPESFKAYERVRCRNLR